MRLLEKGLHGGLGNGNLGALIAGRGVGKSSFLVGVSLDELLRGGTVLHVTLDQSVSHVRDYYDSVFEALAKQSHLDDAMETHAEIDGRRRIRAYKVDEFGVGKLKEAVALESEAGARPTLIVLDGLDPTRLAREQLEDIRGIAQELDVEIWFTLESDDESASALPTEVANLEDLMSVILAMQPDGDEVTLRALKDHDNPDLANLHVALDPKTLLLVRH